MIHDARGVTCYLGATAPLKVSLKEQCDLMMCATLSRADPVFSTPNIGGYAASTSD
jgi:hypothetical protein